MKYNPPLGSVDPEASFFDGDPARDIQGSIHPARASEDPQREIVNAIKGAGMTPDPDDMTQLLKAIKALGGGGILSGCAIPFTGTFGGPNNKHPINRKTGEPDLNYALCDGGTYTAPDGISVTTPDLSSTFVMGGTGKNTGTKGGATTATSSNAGSHTHTVAATGSAGDHAHTGGTTGATTLTADLMPWHTHPQVAYRGYGSSNTSGFTTLSPIGSSFGNNRLYENTEGAGGSGAHAHTGGATSTNGAHTHASGAVSSTGDHAHTVSTLPPYYTLAYIMVL